MTRGVFVQSLKNSLRNIFRNHGVALVLALLAGLLSGAPQHISQYALGDEYRGVPYLFQDAEGVYLTRIQDVLEGHVTAISPFLHEYKDEGMSLMPPIGEYVYVVLSGFGAVPIEWIIMASKYVFPAVLFVLVYALLWLLLKDREYVRVTVALAGASLVVLGYELVHVSVALSIFFGTYEGTYLSLWTRMVNPIVGALCLFGYVISLWFLLQKQYRAAIPAALLLALSSGYIFAFGIGISALFLCVVLALILREKRTAYVLTGVGVISLFLVSPYLLYALMSVAGTGGEESLKTGLLLTHMPLISTVLFGALLVTGLAFAVSVYRDRVLTLSAPVLFCLVLLFAGGIAMNQQILTGRTVWPQHFVQYTIPLAFVALLVVYASLIAPYLGRFARILPSLAVIGSFLFGMYTLPTYAAKLDTYKTVNRYMPALSWLQKVEGPCVVFPVEEFERLNTNITALTECDVYLTHYVFTGVPPERIMHNFLVYLQFQGVTPEEVVAYLDTHEERLWGVFFRDWRDLFFHQHDPYLSSISDRDEIRAWVDRTKRDIVQRYKVFYQEDFKSNLLRYRLDYVMHDEINEPTFKSEEYPFLERAFEGGDVVLYRIAP